MPQPSGLRRAAAEAPKLPPSLSFFVIGGSQLTDADHQHLAAYLFTSAFVPPSHDELRQRLALIPQCASAATPRATSLRAARPCPPPHRPRAPRCWLPARTLGMAQVQVQVAQLVNRPQRERAAGG